MDELPTTIPVLRADVVIEETGDPERPAALFDPALGRRIRLDPRGLQAARLLASPRTLAELATELDTEEETAGKIADFFSRLQLLDSPQTRAFVADATKAAELHAASPAEVPLLIRDDAAFSCTMCGSCCGGHNVGPVMDDILEGLEPHMPKLAARTQQRKGLFFTIAGQQQQGTVLCHSDGGSCVFLSDDRRCVIHEELGGDAKPRVCRLFPYHFVATPKGISVSLQMECRGFGEARAGKPLAEQESEIRSLLAIAPTVQRVRPVIMLDGVSTLSWDDYETLEASLHDAVDAHPDSDVDAMLAMRDVVAKELPAPKSQASELSPESLQRDLLTLLSQLDQAVAAADEHFHTETERQVVHTYGLDEFRTALRHLPKDIRRVLQPFDRKPMRSLFVDKVHNQLMGKELVTAPSIVVGMARTTFSWLLAKALMVARARQVKRRHLVLQDVVDSMVVLNFLFRNDQILEILRQLDGPIVSLFHDRLPALVEAGGDLAPEDPRVELYKF